MRKGIILALTLVVMVLLVGCGVQNQLADTKWKYENTRFEYYFDTETVDEKEGLVTYIETYEYKKDGTYLCTYKTDYSAELEEYGKILESYGMDNPYKDTEIKSDPAKWYCDGDKLYIESSEYPMAKIYDVIILDDELILKQGFYFDKYKKVN